MVLWIYLVTRRGGSGKKCSQSWRGKGSVCLGVMVPLQREGETGRLGRGWRQEGHPAALGEILAVQMVTRI